MEDKIQISDKDKRLFEEIQKRVKKSKKEIDERISKIPEARHEDYSAIVREKIENGGGLSYSSLKRFIESPISYIHYLTAPQKEKTPSLILGSVVDILLTDVANFHEKIFMIPEAVNRRTNEGRQIWEMYQTLAEGKMVIDPEIYQKAVEISEAAWKNDDVRFYLERVARFQVPLRFIHRKTKLPIRGFIDFESEEEPKDHEYFIGDLKTGVSAHENDYPRDYVKWWYNGQVGTYTMGYKYKWKFPAFIHVVVETSEPYNSNVFRIDSEEITEAQAEVQNAIVSFKYCFDNNLWHKSYDFVRDEALRYASLKRPGYYKPKLPM